MEKLPELKLLKFHPDTLEAIRKMYELDKPGQMDQVIDILQEWLNQQKHILKKDFSREFLERMILTTKGSVERAKKRLETMCTMRTLLPELFGNYDVRTYFKELHENAILISILPKLTEDHYRVFAIKPFGSFSTPKLVLDFHREFLLFGEYVRHHDYATGIICVFDFRGFNFLSFMPHMDMTEFNHLVTLVMEGYGARMKAIHMLSSSKFIEIVIALLKQVLPVKIAKRIHIHTTIESIHEHIPKEILPSDLGGEEKSVKALSEEWIEELALKENVEYQRSMNRALVDETLRPTDNNSEYYMGLPGTFRTLCVD